MGCGASLPENGQEDYLQKLLNDKNPQSKLLENNTAGETKIYRWKGYDGELLNYINKSSLKAVHCSDEIANLYTETKLYSLWQVWDNFKYSKQDCMGKRKQLGEKEWGEYEWRSYDDVNAEMEKVCRGLLEMDLNPNAKIGILSQNRQEWTILEWACFRTGFVVVPLYDTLGENAIEYILEQAKVEVAFASKDTIDTLIKSKAKGGQGLKEVKLLCFDDEKKSSEIKVWSDLVKIGEKSNKVIVNPHHDDVAIIMYTSGTTGNPKGAVLTQNNIVSSVIGALSAFEILLGDRAFSFLPLAHIYETISQTITIGVNGSFGFYHGDVRMITDDASKCKPTVFCGVPRVYERVFSVVMAKMSKVTGIKGMVVKKAIAEQTRRVQNDMPRNAWYDKKVFNQVKEALGGKVRIFISGAAPLAPHLASFLRVFFGANVCEGFGMTETNAIVCVRKEHDSNIGNVGPPGPHNEIKLRDVAEMKYLSTDEYPRGELCVRGPNIFKGYFENEEATKEALMEDGWLATGDIARINPNGTLTIIDRKKNIFKLSQGEYVAIEKVEMALTKADLVGQLWAYGDSFQSSLVGIVVPDYEKLMIYAEKVGWPEKEYKAIVLAHYDVLKSLILNNMKEMGKKEKLKGFEQVFAIELESNVNDLKQGFNVENECLTPTFKMKRVNLKEKYAETISKMYAELSKKIDKASI